MTHPSLPSLRKTLLAAGALTVLAAAPAAMAAPIISTDVPVSTRINTDVILVADHKRHRSHHRHHRDRSYKRHKKHKYKYRHHGYRDSGYHYSHKKHYKRHYKPYKHSYKHHRPHYKRHYDKHYRPHYKKHSYHSPYTSSVGISFHFGNSGYSPYRWGPSKYGFYHTGYGSYDYYRSATTCRRINVEAWHHGHRELVSVKQCSNPWDGSYIVQGSERVINCVY